MTRDAAASATITALTAARALQTLARTGHDWETEARRAGVPADLHAEFGWRVAVGCVEALFERGVVLCGPDFPLMARPLRAEENRSPVGLYCRTRDTVRDACIGLVPLWDRVTDAYRVSFEETPTGGVFRWSGVPRPTLWWFDAADTLESLRSVSQPGARVTCIRTPTAAPPGAAGLFGCPIAPGPDFEMVIPRALLAARLLRSDPAIRAHIERQVAALAPPPATGPSVVAILWSLGPTATVPELATATQLSERTLHRRLAEAGTSFRAELDGMRQALAARIGRERSTDEVALLLGYSDSGAYRRAARRWRMTG